VVSYLTTGDARYPKELLEVFGQGMVAKLDNFGRSELWRGGKPTVKRVFGAIDKGQKNEMASFITAVRTGGVMPIALPSLIATTRATIVASRVPGAPGMRSRSAADDTVPEDVASVIPSRRPLEHEPAS
jgi:hypothetical protein